MNTHRLHRLIYDALPMPVVRPLAERVGVERFSHPALHDLDRRIARLIPERDLTFVELGANNGFAQSNTYYLERFRGWRGVLIEPVPELYAEAVRMRPKAKVFNAACVPFGYEAPTVRMTYCNLMSVVHGAMGSDAAQAEHMQRGSHVQGIETYEVEAPARTLTSILEEAGLTSVDFLSLDVEGFELQVLQGLDFTRFSPATMLIEARFRPEIDAFLGDRYEVIEQLTPMDCLYRRLP